MSACVFHVGLRRFGWVALVALGFPAVAQQLQSIQFTKPANQDPVSTANSSLPTSHSSPNSFNAPSSLFQNGGPNFDVLPGGPQPVIYNNPAQWQSAFNREKNWTLMTPEQILNVPTPESILGITTSKEDAGLSLEDRFLRGLDREAHLVATNSYDRPDNKLWGQDDSTTPLGSLRNHTRSDNAVEGNLPVDSLEKTTSPFFDRGSRNSSEFNRADSTWASSFDAPEPLPKPTQEQLAGMERFRAFMNPPAQSQAKALDLTPGSQPVAARDPFLQSLPAFNPAGNSASALENGMTRPTGLMPLSGVTGPRPAPPKPTPLVQPPPWTQVSTPGVFPQRQF